MAFMSKNFAVLQAVQDEMKRRPDMCFFYEYQRPTATGPGGAIIDLFGEFGYPRVWDWGPIDEHWITGCAVGAAVAGCPVVCQLPSMTTLYASELMFNQAGKFWAMHGQQMNVPLVMRFDVANRIRISGPQHADVGMEAMFGNMPGLKIVVPSTVYDAKGLMYAAIEDPDPVMYFDSGEVVGPQDVPTEKFVVPIGEAAIRQEGTDLTIVAYAPASLYVQRALADIAAAGISAEFIDPRTVKPLPLQPILDSLKKTKRLLVVDHGHWFLGTGVQIIAEVVEHLEGIKIRRLAYPDAPVPGNLEMTRWMTPKEENILDAAKKMVQG